MSDTVSRHVVCTSCNKEKAHPAYWPKCEDCWANTQKVRVQRAGKPRNVRSKRRFE